MRHYLLLATFCLSTFLIGQDILTRGEVYDYDVGDEFQYTNEAVAGTIIERYKVLDKEYSLNNDTVFYEMAISHYYAYPDGGGGTTISQPKDTITKFYTYLSDTITNFGGSSQIYDVYLDSTYTYYPDSIIRYDSIWCGLEINGYTSYPPEFEANLYKEVWGRGVGRITNRHIDPSNPGGSTIIEYSLIYYKKGNVECGTQSTLFINDQLKEPKLRIYPNPMNEHLNIEISKSLKVKEVSLYNPQGQRVGVDIIDQGNGYYLNARSLKSGIYTLIIQSNNGVVSKKVSVIH